MSSSTLSHIIFDARIIRGGYSGIARYTSSLLVGLLKSPHLYDRLTVLLEDQFDYSGNENYHLIKKYWRPEAEEVKIKAPPFTWRHHYVISRFVNRQKPDLYFYPHFDVPYWITCKTTFVVHDLFAFYVPRYFGWRNGLMKVYYLLTIKKALGRRRTQLITVSESSRLCVAEVLGELNARGARLVYEASALSLTDRTEATHEMPAEVPFLLYVGNRRPNKNLEFVVKTFEQLKRSFNYPGKLVMVSGTKNWNYDLDKANEKYEFIDLRSHASDIQLNELYQKTDALFYPSLYEGFGMPIVEAAAFGKKIITSNKNSMKEIAPEWALLIDPETTEFREVASKIAHYLQEDFSARPIDYHFCQLSWEQIAQQVFSPTLVEMPKKG